MPDRYRVLPAQSGMIMNSLRSPRDGIDLIQVTLDWGARVRREPFEAAWRAAVRRHPILRTTFHLDAAEGLVQAVEPEAGLDIRWRDDASTDAGYLSPDYLDALRDDRREGFDATGPPMVRLTVLDRRLALLSFHHALLDGLSLRSLVHEVSAAYAAGLRGADASFPQRPPFRGFVEWFERRDMTGAERFWSGYLNGLTPPRPLAGYLGESAPGDADARTYELVVPREDSEQIRQVAKSLGLISSTMISAAWGYLRARYGGGCDAAIAVTRSCRRDSVPDADRIVGMLINNVPLRVRFEDAWTVRDLLAAVDGDIARLREHQLAPMASILSWAGLPADGDAVDTMLMYDRSRLHAALSGGPGEPVAARLDRLPPYAASLIVFDEPELFLSLVVDQRRFVPGSAERMLEQLRALLSAFARDPGARLADLVLDGEDEVVAAWNRTGSAYPREATMAGLFAARVAERPDAAAVIAGDVRWTYADLDRRAETIARELRRRGVGTETPVALALPRGPELIAAALGVLKAGGAYVPLDLASPPPRAAAMIGGTRLAVVTEQTAALVPPSVPCATVAELLAADGGTPHAGGGVAGDTAVEPLPDPAHPLSLAFIIHTSGSSGAPKGVAVPHRAVVRLISDPNFVAIGPEDRVLFLGSPAFDVTTLEIWGALLNGAAVVVAPAGPLGIADTARLLRESGVSVAWLTAGLFHQLVQTDPGALAGPRWFLAGGEALDPGAVRAALAARGGKPLVNGYGPTENTTFTACDVMTDASRIGPSVPIGRPIQQTTVQILGPDGRAVPIGVPGELCTGGDGVARGYQGNAAATARAFVPDPAGTGARLYRTGDLARWRADGTLEFLGRLDDQVKIRGFRVEPGEVETVLRTAPEVGDTCVVVRGEGVQRHLVAYVTPAAGLDADELHPSRLRDFAAGRLPDYLVPGRFAIVPLLPLNASGKVDRSALPEPERRFGTGAGTDIGEAAAAPVGPVEERLAEIWRSLLPVRDPGRDERFFALGGNSLTAARLLFRVREAFGVDLSLGDFYRAPTIAASAAAIGAAKPAEVRIGRRSRAAYRVETPDSAEASALAPEPAAPPSHLLPLAPGWALWRTFCLRGAGLAVEHLAPLGESDPARLTAALHDAANLPALREAVAWQNRHALATGIDALVRRGRGPVRRTTRHRQHEALLASYLQRYCAKNDTIGFFGPVGWAEIDDGLGIRVARGDGRRTTYLEGWAVRAVLEEHVEALRPWLVPRRMPFLGLDDDRLLVPLAAPIPLTPLEAAVFEACDGTRTAAEIAHAVAGDPGEVSAALGRLADARRVAWRVDIPPQAVRPELAAAGILGRVADESVREQAGAALAELTEARDGLARAAGRADVVASAMASLEETFVRLTKASPTRRAGSMYAGRTLAYEECLRADSVRLGSSMLDGFRDALALVLDSARWFTVRVAGEYRRRFEETYRRRAAELGTHAVPFADFWLLANEEIFDTSGAVSRPAVQDLQERWSALLGLGASGAGGSLRVSAADLAGPAAEAFPASPPPWPAAVHHSPDLMIADADPAASVGRPVTWVLGEVHPGMVTTRYASWMEFHPAPDAARAGLHLDLGGGTVFAAETAELGGPTARLSNALADGRDHRLVFAHDACGVDPGRAVVVGECDVVEARSGLRVRRRDGTFEADLLEVLGDLLTGSFSQAFRMLPPAAHTPRVRIDHLVISREAWTFRAADVPFADIADEAARYGRAREWAAGHGLPRHVFVRISGERKPVYADLTSLASVDVVSRAVRRARRAAGDEADVTVAEMLPAPDQTWLTDASGRRYTSELRMVAVDLRGRG